MYFPYFRTIFLLTLYLCNKNLYKCKNYNIWVRPSHLLRQRRKCWPAPCYWPNRCSFQNRWSVAPGWSDGSAFGARVSSQWWCLVGSQRSWSDGRSSASTRTGVVWGSAEGAGNRLRAEKGGTWTTYLFNNANQIDCWAHVDMQLARAQDEGLRHNHLKIHKVRNDSSRGRNLGVKFYFECKVRKGEEPWSGKSKYGNWVRLVYVINSSLNASVNSKQKPFPAGLCWEIVASARNVALIEMQIKQFQFGTQKWNKNERILYKWSASYTFRIVSIWSGSRSGSRSRSWRRPYSQK